MKILSLKIKDHKVLGNLELDFSVKRGAGERVAPKSVIIAGDNGTGKSALLKILEKPFDSSGVGYDGSYEFEGGLDVLSKIESKLKLAFEKDDDILRDEFTSFIFSHKKGGLKVNY